MPSFFPNSMKDIQITPDAERVAIVMRTYNRPVLLVRAFASVLQQTYQNWHLYLVNDGGDKVMLENLLADYRSAFGERLTVIHHETNHGMEAASNSALKQAEGDFVIIHDDDDTWHPAFLQKTTEFLNMPENHCYAGVITNCEMVFEQLEENRIIEKNREKWDFFQKNLSFSDLLFANNAPPISFLIRKSVVDAVGYFNSDLPVLGDWDYILRVMQIGDIGTIDEIIAYYHHRIKTNHNDIYSNTTIAGVERHKKYNVLYTNALIRTFLKSDPGAIGLLRLIMLKNDEKMDALIHQNQLQFEELKTTIKNYSFFKKLTIELNRIKKKYLIK